MNKVKVLATRAFFREAVAPLRPWADVQVHEDDQAMSPEALRERAQDCDLLLITLTDRIDAALIAACPRLKAVCTATVGHNHIDLAACSQRGIVVTNTPDVLTETTADLGMALLLAAARRMSPAERALREGQWKGLSNDWLAPVGVHGRRLGIVGMGRIGRAIARRAALGFGMKVSYFNRQVLPQELTRETQAQWMPLESLMREADHVMVVLPYGPQTHHRIGERELSWMQPHATLIHLGRGGVVDDAALARALHRGDIAGAGLDVYENEPDLHPDLLTAPGTVLLPHLGSAEASTRQAMNELAVANAVQILQARDALTPV